MKVWDPRQKDSPVACMEPAEGEVRRDCWSVAFGNSFSDVERCVCAGYDNGDVKMFDLRTMTQRWETNIKNGVSRLVISYSSSSTWDGLKIVSSQSVYRERKFRPLPVSLLATTVSYVN